MGTRVGIGSSTNNISYDAGVDAARFAMSSGGLDRCDFVFLFSAARHNQEEVLRGVRSITKDAPLIGGSTYGIISADTLGYEGHEVGVAVFQSDSLSFRTFTVGDLNRDESEAGRRLGQIIQNARTPEDKVLLVFYDSVRSASPPAFNFATLLFEGMEETLHPFPIAAGGGILEDDFLSRSFQFIDDRVVQQHVVAVMIGGRCTLDTSIVHGCKPAGSYRTITRAEGPVIYEIDGKPALDMIHEMLGPGSTLEWKDFPLFVTLGVNNGEKFGPFREEDYANRLTLAVDPERKALIMFEPDLKEGMQVQLMRRSIDHQYVDHAVASLEKRLAGKRPLFSLYIDCAGRRKASAGGTEEEAAAIQRAIGGRIPLLGFYSGVEVAQLGGRMRPLDWTGVLCVLSEE